MIISVEVKGLVLSGSKVLFRKWCKDKGLDHKKYKSCVVAADIYGYIDIPVYKGYGRPEHWLSIGAYLEQAKIKPIDFKVVE